MVDSVQPFRTMDSEIITLKDQALLAFLSENPGLKEKDAIEQTGYFKYMPDGSKRMNRTAYFKAISAANGYVPAKPEKAPRGPVGPKGVLVVGPSGLLPLGPAYTRLLNLVPGDYVSVYVDEGALVVEPNTAEAVAAKLAADAKAAKATAELSVVRDAAPASVEPTTLLPDFKASKETKAAKVEKVAA